MVYALSEGVKCLALPNTNGLCPVCKKKVFSKCGDVYVWHWAHYPNEECISDSFIRPGTHWQEKWKKIFGAEKSEILIDKDGELHIADIFIKDIVIMLYDTRISKKLINKIEDFFGKRMFWIVNAKKQGFSIEETEFSKICKEYFYNTYDVVDGKVIEKETGEVVDDSRMYIPKYDYSWSELCTNGADTLTRITNRNIFIDSEEEDTIVYIPNDKNMYKCKKIKLENFIKKYT